MVAGAPRSSQGRRWAAWTLPAVTGAYFFTRMRYGWVPNDSGLAAQCAEYVLNGAVPHRDFAEYYTGGLTLLNAGAMAIFGVELIAMNWPLFAFALAFVVSVHRVALGVASSALAFFIALVAAVWSIPNYFFPLPTWYNAFFGVFGLLALLRYFDTERRRWLLLSGLVAGVSVLFKAVGVYVVAATLLALLYREQACTRGPSASAAARRARLVLGGGLCVLPMLVLLVLAKRLDSMTAALFLVPPVALSALLLVRITRSAPRLGTFARETGIYLAGVVAPVLVYLAPYLATWGIDALVDDVFVTFNNPRGYYFFGAWLQRPQDFVDALPWIALFVLGLRSRPLPGHVWWAVGALPVLVWILAKGSRTDVYSHVWASTRPVVPAIVVIGCVELLRARQDGPRQNRLFALLAHAGMFNLVQFPNSDGVNFCFVSGLVLLAGLELVQYQGGAPRPAHLVMLAFYAAFALTWLNRGATYTLGWHYVATSDFVPLADERAGILVSPSDARTYRAVVASVRAHSRPDDAVFVAPDIPEVQFLAARRNPTGTFFDAFDPDFYDPPARNARILRTLEEQRVPVVVLADYGDHSGPPNPALVAALEQRYPASSRFGAFVVRWRPDPTPAAAPPPI